MENQNSKSDECTPEQIKKAQKEYNRKKQKEFYDSMVKNGYRRRHNWLSKRAVELLNELSESYSKELVLSEALEMLALVKKKWPDSQFADAKTLETIMPRMAATTRGNEKHFDDAEKIMNKRLKKFQDFLEGK